MNTTLKQILFSNFVQLNNSSKETDLISSYILIAVPLLMFTISFIAFILKKPKLYYLNNLIGFLWVILVISKLVKEIIEIFPIFFSS